VAATAIMLWRDISISPDYILLLCVPIAVLSGRLLGFLRDWIPFVVLFLGYEGMRAIAPKLGVPPHVRDVAGAERALFAGHVPSAVLQAAFTGTLGRVIAYAATVVYFCHFVFPFGVGLVLWIANRTQFLRYTTGLLAMAFLGFVVFLLFPAAPPWLAEDRGVVHGVAKLLNTTLPSYVSPYYNALNPNKVAALPSLHAAFPFMSFLALRPVHTRAAWVALGWALLVAFSVVYLGEHWVIDVLAGMAFAALCWAALMRVVVPRVRALQRQEPAPATEPANGAAVA
jgi:membrane-associated phospholipid phosphatase